MLQQSYSHRDLFLRLASLGPEELDSEGGAGGDAVVPGNPGGRPEGRVGGSWDGPLCPGGDDPGGGGPGGEMDKPGGGGTADGEVT